jgi:hypothetical protein
MSDISDTFQEQPGKEKQSKPVTLYIAYDKPGGRSSNIIHSYISKTVQISAEYRIETLLESLPHAESVCLATKDRFGFAVDFPRVDLTQGEFQQYRVYKINYVRTLTAKDTQRAIAVLTKLTPVGGPIERDKM